MFWYILYSILYVYKIDIGLKNFILIRYGKNTSIVYKESV